MTVSVGYEYESCLDIVLWEKRVAQLQGFELMPSNLGGWTLNQHHVLNLESGEGLSLAHTHAHVCFLQLWERLAL